MGKYQKANSKKAASRTNASVSASTSLAATASSSSSSEPLFEIDTKGSSTVRHALLRDYSSSSGGVSQGKEDRASSRLRKGMSFNKPLKSDQILALRSSVPALTSRVVPSQQVLTRKEKEKLGKIDRSTKERLRRIAGRDGEGSGLWSIKSGGERPEALTEAVRKAGEYDAWEVRVEDKQGDLEDQDLGMSKVILANTKTVVPKPPRTLHDHSLLKEGGGGPRSIPVPHPGMSYNPSLPHHQALLQNVLTKYTVEEEREERGQPVKDAMDELRKLSKGKEAWEMYQEEVGSGEEDEDAELVDPEAIELRLKKKQPKRKTRQQRNRKLRVAAEALDLTRRRAQKLRTSSVLTAPVMNESLDTSKALSLAEKAAALMIKKARINAQGLTRLRSGPSRVPDAPINFQLGEELSENLRTLQTEGNLWKEWVRSGMRRGKVPVERANESKKGGKRGGRGRDKGSKLKTVEKYSYKNFAV